MKKANNIHLTEHLTLLQLTSCLASESFNERFQKASGGGKAKEILEGFRELKAAANNPITSKHHKKTCFFFQLRVLQLKYLSGHGTGCNSRMDCIYHKKRYILEPGPSWEPPQHLLPPNSPGHKNQGQRLAFRNNALTHTTHEEK